MKIFQSFISRLEPEQKRLWNTLVFLIRLLALSIPLYAVMVFLNLGLMQNAVASQSYWMFRITGYSIAQDGPSMTIEPGSEAPFSFFISEDSTGWKAMLFFSALVIATPQIKNRKRLLGLAGGLALIWILNLSRIFSIVLLERHYSLQAALFAHDYIWNFGMVLCVLTMWILWLRFAGMGKIFTGKTNINL